MSKFAPSSNHELCTNLNELLTNIDHFTVWGKELRRAQPIQIALATVGNQENPFLATYVASPCTLELFSIFCTFKDFRAHGVLSSFRPFVSHFLVSPSVLKQLSLGLTSQQAYLEPPKLEGSTCNKVAQNILTNGQKDEKTLKNQQQIFTRQNLYRMTLERYKQIKTDSSLQGDTTKPQAVNLSL